MLVFDSCGRDTPLFEQFTERFNSQWQLTYAKKSEDVLNILEGQNVDVVAALVDDQSQNSLKLFDKVKKVSSETYRLALTNHVNERHVANRLDTVSGYTTIDTDVDALHSHLERGLFADEVLSADKIFLQFDIESKFPSIPKLYLELLELFKSESVSVKEVSALIKQDPAMTAKLIQLVNSSFFGLRRVIVSAEDAAVMIGLEPIKALVLSDQIFKIFENSRVPESYLTRLWNHSTLTAAFARCIARFENADRTTADIAFTAGMLHDIGKLLMLEHLPEEYLEYAAILTEDTYESMDVERMIFGTTHTNLGAYLLKKWGFNDSLLEPILFHHKPLWLHKEFSALHAVFAADCFYHEFFGQADESARLGAIRVDCHSLLNKAHIWKDACHALIV